MLIRLKDSDVKSINYLEKPQEVMYPETDVPQDRTKLKGFGWYDLLRPINKEDIFNTDPED